MEEEKININLGQLLNAFSMALDIASNRYYGHSRRTAYIAHSLAKELGLSKYQVENIYYASLIHDIGMSGQMARYSVEEIHFSYELKREHCKLGHDIIDKLPLDSSIANSILYHHEEYNGLGVFKLKGDEIPLQGQIIHIADQLELFLQKKMETGEMLDSDTLKKELDLSRNKRYKGEHCDALISLLDKEKFWFDLQTQNIIQALNTIEPNNDATIDITGLKSISNAFSILIDSRSPFTHEHSQGIAAITKDFAEYLGYPSFEIEKLEIAANLHDLGKMAVPNSILEKKGKLTESEFYKIKAHPYYTKLILKQIKGLEEISEWAGNHHEKLNGSGYPEKLDYNNLSKEDQIIALSDIYQALTEDRPYREGLSSNKAINIMEGMANEGHIDKYLLLDLKQVVG